MSEEKDGNALYQIKVKGVLQEQWSDWFNGLVITPHPDGYTTLVGPVRDQAALHGLMNKIRDIGLTLLAVKRLERPSLDEG